MTIRTGTAADEPGIVALLRQLHPDQPPERFGPVRQTSHTFVAEDGGRVIGFALVTSVDYGLGERGSSYGAIEELVVDEAVRGQGIGRSLVEACCRWVAEQNINVVFVSAVDDAAERFYVGQRFTRCTGPWLYRSLRIKGQ